jgi:nitrogen fixation protein NifX
MKVAFASSDGMKIDLHFGTANAFHLWDIGVETACYLGTIATDTAEDEREDKIVARANALQDCAIVYSLQIGGPAAAKLVARHVHPMKTGKEMPIRQVIADLRRVLIGRPPPWLRKALGQARSNLRRVNEDEQSRTQKDGGATSDSI